MANGVPISRPFEYANAMLILRLNWFSPRFDLQKKIIKNWRKKIKFEEKQTKPNQKKKTFHSACVMRFCSLNVSAMYNF